MAYSSIVKPSDYFNTKLYTGTGSSNAITGVGFQPDFTWIKKRSGAENHALFDAVRGVTKMITPNENYAESTVAASLTSFDSDGFTLGNVARSNASGGSLVSWNWKAGGGQGSSNTDGSINTTYTSASTTSGFSIIKYPGTGSSATIGHGLGATPKVCFFKQLDGTESWRVWHRDAPNYSTKATALNLNSAEFDQTGWVGTVNNSTIQLGSDGSINLNAKNYICYAFAEKTGFSKFGLYSGNGNANGTFVYTGFKPAFVMIKYVAPTGGVGDWNMYDSKRLGYNGGDAPLFADLNNAESTDYGRIDFLSNGFKLRTTNSQLNELGSGSTYIYMAFAEAPLVGSNNVPATAR